MLMPHRTVSGAGAGKRFKTRLASKVIRFIAFLRCLQLYPIAMRRRDTIRGPLGPAII